MGFTEFAYQWIKDNLSMEQVLSCPDVIQIVKEEFNNDILQSFMDSADEGE